MGLGKQVAQKNAGPCHRLGMKRKKKMGRGGERKEQEGNGVNLLTCSKLGGDQQRYHLNLIFNHGAFMLIVTTKQCSHDQTTPLSH